MTILFTQAAEQERDEAADYYEAQSQGLGEAFLDEVEQTILLIAAKPMLGPLYGQYFRQRRMRRFWRYRIVFEVEASTIWIHAVWHGMRNPQELDARLSANR